MKRLLAALALVGASIAAAVVLGLAGDDVETTPVEPDPALATVPVRRTDLVVTGDLDGSLGFVAADPVVNRLPGTLTDPPEPGTTYVPGDVLYRVDDTPVVLAAGAVPMYRPLSTRSADGRDVEQLERMLVDAGYDPELEVDGDFTAATRDAVRAWQEDLGLDDSGIVELGRIVFVPDPIRVVEVPVAPGAPIGDGTVVATTSTTETKVTALLPGEDQGLLAAGDPVVVELPDGTETPGTVTSVGAVARRTPDGTFFDVEIDLDDPTVGAGLDEAPVTVVFEKERAEDVLAVPVTALVALAEGGYAVELVDGDRTRLVAVVPGTFADGLVEVVGELDVGDEVVVP